MELVDQILVSEILSRIGKMEKYDQLEVGYKLNNWEFPIEFYDILPDWWWYNGTIDRKIKIIRPIRDYIESIHTHKEVLKYHNASKGNMTFDEFEYWYSIKDCETLLLDFSERRRFIENIKFWDDDVFSKIINAVGVSSN